MKRTLPGLILATAVLSACGGGGGSGGESAAPAAAPAPAPAAAPAAAPTAAPTPAAAPAAAPASEPASAGTSDSSTSTSNGSGSASAATTAATQTTGAAAPDGPTSESAAFAYLNELRRLAGVAVITPDTRFSTAARLHAGYVGETNVVGHYETTTTAVNYRGYAPADRVAAQGVVTTYTSEGLTRAVGTDAVVAVDLLVSSIYHRFGLFNNYLTHGGAGVQFKTVAGSQMVDLTIDFANLQAVALPARSALSLWPAAGALNVTTGFDSDSESPDPVAGKNKVGYPVSVQVDPRYTLTVGSFTLTEVGTGLAVSSRILASAWDSNTPRYAAALIPESVLKPATAYRASFTGTVDGQAVTQSWTFTTAAYGLTPDRTSVAPGASVSFNVGGIDPTESYYVCWDNGTLLSQSSLKFLSPVKLSLTAASGCTSASGCPVKVTVARDNACSVPVAQATVSVTQ